MIKVIEAYQIKIQNVPHFVYEALCDGIPTKYITKKIWDLQIRFAMVSGEIKYFDSDGNPILVYEEDDYQYKHYVKKS
jgi:hypothetical protein